MYIRMSNGHSASSRTLGYAVNNNIKQYLALDCNSRYFIQGLYFLL